MVENTSLAHERLDPENRGGSCKIFAAIGAKGSEGDSYIKIMEANIRSIIAALGRKYTPFQPKK